MDLHEMHVWFRQYAQQMGMQNVRAILPEQIDLLINTSIDDTINQLIRENIGVTNDRIVTDNSKIGQINALRSLYKVLPVVLTGASKEPKVHFDDEDSDIGKFYVTNFTEKYNNTEPLVNALFVIDLSINYKHGNKKTNYYPVRLIDDIYLADTLQDFVLKPRVRTPIAVMYNNQLDVYLGEDYTTGNGFLTGSTLTPNELRVSYLSKPAKVKYRQDMGEPNIECDLPESLHVDILKHAVDLYRISVSGALNASQQQEQQQQRENARNNYRNEGNQQQ